MVLRVPHLVRGAKTTGLAPRSCCLTKGDGGERLRHLTLDVLRIRGAPKLSARIDPQQQLLWDASLVKHAVEPVRAALLVVGGERRPLPKRFVQADVGLLADQDDPPPARLSQ